MLFSVIRDLASAFVAQHYAITIYVARFKVIFKEKKEI